MAHQILFVIFRTTLYVYTCFCLMQVLNAIPDQDTFYDVSDALEEQGLEKVIANYRSRKGVERDLMNQLNLYEAMLRHEDGVSDAVTTAELGSHMDIRFNCFLTLCLIPLMGQFYCNSAPPPGSLGSQVVTG